MSPLTPEPIRSMCLVQVRVPDHVSCRVPAHESIIPSCNYAKFAGFADENFFFFIGTILADEDDQASGLPQQAFSLSGWLRRPIRGGDRTTAGADGRGAEISG